MDFCRSKLMAMSPLNVELQTHSVISTSGRNLTSIECIKISPAGRNDRLLIKLSILSVIELIENTATHGTCMYFTKCATDNNKYN
jgi:hypothetical protein